MPLPARGNIDYDQIQAAARRGNGGRFQMAASGTVSGGNLAVYDGDSNVTDPGRTLSSVPYFGGVKLLTASYTAQESDEGCLLVFASAVPVTLLLPIPTDPRWNVQASNIGAGSLTVSAGTRQLDESYSVLTVPAIHSVGLFTDGTNYYTARGLGVSVTTPSTGMDESLLMSVPGTLAIGSDLAPWVFTSSTQAASGVQIWVEHAPSGSALTCQLYVGGVAWMTLVIPDGGNSVSATAAQMAAAAPIAAGAPIRVDITTTGSVYPGGDLGVLVFFPSRTVTGLLSDGVDGAVMLSTKGRLAVDTDLAPWVFLPATQPASAVQVQVKNAPLGASLTCQILVAGVTWMTLTIPAGSTSVSATAAQMAAAAPITAGSPIRLDITSAGLTYPGSDLSAMIFFPPLKPSAGTGEAALLSVSGMLAIGSDQAPWISLSSAQSVTAVQLKAKQAPTGAPLVCQIYAGTSPWMTLTLPDGAGSASATAAQIAAAPAIAAGAPVRLDISSVGTTFPGSDLSVMVFF
jgi:hypothetical protein